MSKAATARRGYVKRDRCDERGDTMIEILMTLTVLSIAVVALIVTFATGISASVDHKNLAANDVVLRQVEEQAFYQIQQRSSPKALYTSCATNAANGPYSGITYNNLASGYTVTMNPIQYWDATTAQFDGTCAAADIDSPQLISLSLAAPNGSSATTTFVVDDLGAGTSGALAVNSCSLTPPATPTPCSAIQGTSNLALYLTGTGFASDATVAFSGTGVAVNSTTFVTSTLLDLNVTVASNAPVTTYSVTVTNPGVGSATSGQIFTVLAVPPAGMHVSMSAGDFFLSIWPIVDVTVTDASGRPVRHATVTGSWNTTPGGFNITTNTCTTDGSGSCYILYDLFGFPTNGGSATYTISGITATGQTYTLPPTPPSITVSWP